MKLNSKSLTVKLTQFPLVPTSAVTVHKVQGQSLDRVIVTKWLDPKMVSQYPMTAYVTLSRVRTLAGLYITQPLSKADCAFFVPPLAVIDELERLDKLQPQHFRSSDALLRSSSAC
jgi:ATP-dependent exoDNAse (exonuclease V) alpha subunit